MNLTHPRQIILMLIYVIPLLLGAAFFIPLISLKFPKVAPAVAITASGIAFLLVLMSAPPILNGEIFKWSMSGWSPPIGIAIAVDGLGLLMALIITGLGFSSAAFSYRYVSHRKAEFYTVLLLIV